MNEPAYIDGSEVHAGDIVDHAGARATVVLVVARGECSSGYSIAEWAEFGGILIRQDDGQLYMYEYVNDEEDIVLLSRRTE